MTMEVNMSTQQRKTVRQTALQSAEAKAAELDAEVKRIKAETEARVKRAYADGLNRGEQLLAEVSERLEAAENALKGGRWRGWVRENPARAGVILVAGGIAVWAFVMMVKVALG